MLAFVTAVQLVVLAQVSGPPEPAPAGEAPPAAAPPARAAAPAPERPRQLSLISAESLHGGSAALAWAGWPQLGVTYGIGFSLRDDLGFSLAHDWAKSETHIGAFYRRALRSKAGPFDMGMRLSVAWFVNSGADFIYDENHSDRGMEAVPGFVLSRRGTAGIASAVVEAPMIVTWKYRSGFLFTPRASFAFETPLYSSLTVGALIGLGFRAGAGDAPLKEGRAEVQFLILAGYQLL